MIYSMMTRTFELQVHAKAGQGYVFNSHDTGANYVQNALQSWGRVMSDTLNPMVLMSSMVSYKNKENI